MSKADNRAYLILKDPNIYKGLIFLSLPVMFNNLIKTFHDLIDMYFVSQIPEFSAASVSAISVTFPILFMFISIGIGLSVAGTSLISQLIGAGQREEARTYATNLFLIAIIIGIVLTVAGYFGAPYIMKWMGTTGYLFEKSTKYLQIRSFELVAVFIMFAFTSIRQADGDTISPVIFGVVTMIINIILSPILISVLQLGVEGAAYATLIGNIVILPFVLYQLYFSKSGITIYRIMRFKSNIARAIIQTAIPAALGQSITAIGFIVMNGIIVSYGEQTLAAFSVGNRISSLVLHPVMAIGGILAAYIGQNIGNGNPGRAKDAFKKGIILSVGVISVTSLIMLFIRVPVISLFLENDDVALKLAVTYMFYLLIGLPFMAIFQAFIGAYNGNGKTSYTLIVGVTRLWGLRIPLILFFTYFTVLGSSGIWTAMLISNFMIMFIGFYFYKKLQFVPKIDVEF
jgi:putative MATE family efflux protein